MQAKFSARVGALVVFLLFSSIASAHAGMTVYSLKDIFRLRFEELSFFLVLLIVCAVLFQLLWNHAARGFTVLPRLKFFQAFSVAILGGLVMLLILTMISGIREVLTPEAWRHQGTSYRLNDPSQEPARRRSLEHLRAALFDYARNHEGRFPAYDFVPEISEKLWESPDQFGTHYLYTAGLTTNDARALLAVEPVAFGESRFVLLASGEIQRFSTKEIDERWNQANAR